MLKAAVIDDEFIVLQGLQAMIDWPKYGIELIGTASNGQKGWELFSTHNPDIVFTDIRMPVMDGLELIEKIMGHAPDTKCVVFSGFNEFEYVKKALKLGVVDYIEKPITIEAIESAVKKILDEVNEEDALFELKNNWESSRGDLLEKAVIDLLEGTGSESKWKRYFGAEADKVTGVTVLALSSDRQSIQATDSYKVVPIQYGNASLNIIFHFTKRTTKLFEQLINWPEGMGVTIGSGRTYKKVEYLQKSCKEAVEALRYGEFINEKGWTRIDDIDENPQLPEDLSETEKTLIYFMRIGDKEGYLETLWDIAAQLQQEKLHRGVLEREIVKMMYSALEVAKETGNDFDKSLQHFVPHLEIRELKSKEGVYNWFTSKMEMIMDWSLNVRGTKRHSAIEYSCLYMEKHYGRDLSLQEVAEKAEMNPTYFSLLFKEKMGQSYIKYLTSIRMEKAKNFLLKGEKVTVVSEKVGYNSHRHFSVIFKKYFGVPPGHFKENEKLTF